MGLIAAIVIVGIIVGGIVTIVKVITEAILKNEEATRNARRS